MTPPPKKHAALVEELLALDPTPNTEYTTNDLQSLAAGTRLGAEGDPDLLAVANCLDALSALTPEDVKYLASLKPPKDAPVPMDSAVPYLGLDQSVPEGY